MKADTKDKHQLRRRILPVQFGAVGLLAILALATLLAGMTAQECHTNLVHSHVAESIPFAPSLLFGVATWFWWLGVVVGLWVYARRVPALLHFSLRWGMVHLMIGCTLAVLHLALLQHTVSFAAARWPVWGDFYSALYVYTPRRFGWELAAYGFIYGFSCLFYSQFQTHEAVFQKLEVEQQLVRAQLKALQMQLEPHFLFNTLNAITSLIAQGRNKEATKTMSHLNTILRTTLQRKAPEKVPFAEELRVVESYLAIQQVRFAGRLEVKINATPEALDGLVPCFLLQPIVENAIQHGIAPLESGGPIETSITRVGDMLRMEVKDNGCGSTGPNTKGHGIGMQNIRERLTFFYPGAFEFDAVAPVGGGYVVRIQIPYERAIA